MKPYHNFFLLAAFCLGSIITYLDLNPSLIAQIIVLIGIGLIAVALGVVFKKYSN